MSKRSNIATPRAAKRRATIQPPHDTEFSTVERTIWDALVREKPAWSTSQLRRLVILCKLQAHAEDLASEVRKLPTTLRNPQSGRVAAHPLQATLAQTERSIGALRRELLPQERRKVERQTTDDARAAMRAYLEAEDAREDPDGLLKMPEDPEERERAWERIVTHCLGLARSGQLKGYTGPR